MANLNHTYLDLVIIALYKKLVLFNKIIPKQIIILERSLFYSLTNIFFNDQKNKIIVKLLFAFFKN